MAELTIGYRVPAPILEVANRLLADAAVAVPPSRSARLAGTPPSVRRVAVDQRWRATAAAVAELRAEGHALTGVVVPAGLARRGAPRVGGRGPRPVDHLDGLHGEVPVLAADGAKGLELDGVVVVEPGDIADGVARGARLLYIALTRGRAATGRRHQRRPARRPRAQRARTSTLRRDRLPTSR